MILPKLPKWLQKLYDQWKDHESDPAFMGVRFDGQRGAIDDGAIYNDFSQGKPEWLQKESEGWIPLK